MVQLRGRNSNKADIRVDGCNRSSLTVQCERYLARHAALEILYYDHYLFVFHRVWLPAIKNHLDQNRRVCVPDDSKMRGQKGVQQHDA